MLLAVLQTVCMTEDAMPEGDIQSMTATAREHDVRVSTISDMVKLIRLPTHPMSNGRAKGLDKEAQRVIRERLRPVPKSRGKQSS